MDYIIEVQKLDHQGRGIAYIDDIITFIPGILPDEKARVRITKKNKKFNEAEMIEILKSSSFRVEPICKYFSSCGGCQLMHMSYAEELKYKENKVREIIKKFTSIDPSIVKGIVSNPNLEYRNKATFQVKEKVGYYKEKSYEIIDIEVCKIINPKINELLNIVKKMDLDNVYQIVIRTSLDESMIIFKLNKEKNINIDVLKKYTSTIVTYHQDYKVIYGNGYIVDEIGEYKFFVSPDSFFQINNNMVSKLYTTIKNYIGKCDNLLDLYCGTGTIGIYLSDISKKVLGVEINKYAVEDAYRNKELNRVKNIEFICQSTSDFREINYFDAVVVDPPRSGLDSKTVDYLIKMLPEKMVYVSCDPITLARDLNILGDFYDIKEITPVDMFSRTYHMECVTLLSLKKIK